MTFLHKLAKRLSMTWRGRTPILAALLLPHVPVNLNSRSVLVSACLATLVWLRRAVSIRLFRSDFHTRRLRAGCVLVRERRRLSDRHPCREVFVRGTHWGLRIAIVAVPKVGA